MYLPAGLGEILLKVHIKDGRTHLKDVVSAIFMLKLNIFLVWKFSDSFTGICSNGSKTVDKLFQKSFYILRATQTLFPNICNVKNEKICINYDYNQVFGTCPACNSDSFSYMEGNMKHTF